MLNGCRMREAETKAEGSSKVAVARRGVEVTSKFLFLMSEVPLYFLMREVPLYFLMREVPLSTS